MKKIFKVALLAILPLSLTACMDSHVSSKFRQTSFNKPVIISSYAFDGQKLSQIKSSSATVSTDSKTIGNDPQALDIIYGQNKTLHQGSSLIAYSGLINYADSYQNWLSKQMPQTENKSKPSVGQFYDYYQAMLNQKKFQDDTVVFINSKDGSIIGAFIGENIVLHTGTNSAITQFKIDKHQVLIYQSHYATYPIKTLKSIADNEKAPLKNGQKKVKIVDDASLDSSKKNKTKKVD